VPISPDEIKDHWVKSAETAVDADGLRPAARDPFLQDVVESRIEKWLQPNDRVIDIGCGDGNSTVRFGRQVKKIVGVDYVDKFIQTAKSSAQTAGLTNATFETADVLNLTPISKKFDKFNTAVSIRCLINLNTWEKQAAALEQIANCIKPGGLYLTSEGWEEGFDNLNLLRNRVGISEMSVVKYNLLIKRTNFEREVKKYFDIIDYQNAGLFLFLSRVVQPMLVAPEPASHQHRLNQVAAELEKETFLGNQLSACDYAGVYVLRRK
jgi:ubiquinone/menaquinone biosynthesis C-methylase UbiE